MTGHKHKFNRCECGAKQGGVPGAGRRKLYTDEQVLRWVEMHKTMTIQQIAAAEGLPIHRIYGPMRKSGLPMTDHRHRQTKITTEQNRERYAEAIRLYEEEGWTLQEIGARYGLSRERVRQWFVMAGVQDMPGKRRQARKEQHAAEREANQDEPIECPWGCGKVIPRHDMQAHLFDGPGKHRGLRFGTRMPSERWDGVAADYAAGMRFTDIMEKWGMEGSSIMRSVDAHGIPHRVENKILPTRAASAARKERVLALHRTGKFSYPDLAVIEKCSTTRIGQIVRGAK